MPFLNCIKDIIIQILIMSINASIKNVNIEIKDKQDIVNEDQQILKQEITNKMLEELKKKLEVLDKRRHVEILQILNKHNVNCTENNNGVFVNLSKIDNTVIEKLFKYIKYLENQEKIIESFEKEKMEYLKLL